MKESGPDLERWESFNPFVPNDDGAAAADELGTPTPAPAVIREAWEDEFESRTFAEWDPCTGSPPWKLPMSPSALKDTMRRMPNDRELRDSLSDAQVRAVAMKNQARTELLLAMQQTAVVLDAESDECDPAIVGVAAPSSHSASSGATDVAVRLNVSGEEAASADTCGSGALFDFQADS